MGCRRDCPWNRHRHCSDRGIPGQKYEGTKLYGMVDISLFIQEQRLMRNRQRVCTMGDMFEETCLIFYFSGAVTDLNATAITSMSTSMHQCSLVP